MSETLFQKVWNLHVVRTLPSGQTQLFVGLHLVHEVTSPQAFDMLRQHGWRVAFPDRTFATVDHIVPTDNRRRPFLDVVAEEMTAALEKNCREFGIPLSGPEGPLSENQGIVHVIGPELGLTQPGMTIACGDSHTSTHGALGALAFGIGTSQVRDVLASQCLALDPLKVRRIDVPLERWPAALDGLRVAAVSDLHTGAPHVDDRRVARIVGKVNAQRPDLVALVGDYADPTVPLGEVKPMSEAEPTSEADPKTKRSRKGR